MSFLRITNHTSREDIKRKRIRRKQKDNKNRNKRFSDTDTSLDNNSNDENIYPTTSFLSSGKSVNGKYYL